MTSRLSSEPSSGPTPRPWHPKEYHKLAVKWLLEHAAAGLFLPPGMGKTASTLAAFKILKQERVADRMLVVAPRRVARSVWPKQLHLWTDFHGLRLEMLHGSGREDALRRRADIYVTTYEGLRWLAQMDGRQARYQILRADTLVMDELSKLKHTRTERFKTLKPMLPSFRRRWGLTGSPAANSLMNLFGECFALDLGRSLGAYVTHFRQQYFDPTGYGGYSWAVKKGGERRIYERLKPLALHLSEKQYLKLPELEPNEIEVELDEESRRVYDDLETRLFTLLPDRVTEVIAPNAGAALGKCRQVANGALYHTDKSGERRWTALHDAKLEALEDLVDELQGDPIMVAYQFDHDRERIMDRLGLKDYLGGGVSDKRASRIEDAWNAGEISVLPVQPTTVAHGLNLQEGPGHHLCWFAETWNYEEYDQLIRRLRRPGQKAAKVIVHHITAKDTVDEVMVATRARKARTERRLLEALMAYRQRRAGARRNKRGQL